MPALPVTLYFHLYSSEVSGFCQSFFHDFYSLFALCYNNFTSEMEKKNGIIAITI